MAMETREVRAYSPGRVNLIGDHTDYNEGVAVPMAIDLGTTVTFVPDGSRRVCFTLPRRLNPGGRPLRAARHRAPEDHRAALGPLRRRGRRGGRAENRWMRQRRKHLAHGRGSVLERLARGGARVGARVEAEPLHLAETCQRAEQAATGVDCGLMDQLVVTAAVEDCALLVDFADLSARPVHIPEQPEVIVAHSGASPHAGTFPVQHPAAPSARQPRTVWVPSGGSGRRTWSASPTRCCAGGPGTSSPSATVCAGLPRRSSTRTLGEAGRLMTASHRSLAQDFEASTPALDGLVEHLLSLPGVFGARLTGAGFGGCVVALTEPGAVDTGTLRAPAWRVRPSGGARLLP